MNILSVTVQTWQLAGISVGVVFSILVALVLVLGIFTTVAKNTKAKVVEVKSDITTNKQAKAFSEASEQDKAALAVAVYLYFNDDHDHESGVLTINNAPSNWGKVLNPRL